MNSFFILHSSFFILIVKLKKFLAKHLERIGISSIFASANMKGKEI